MKDQSVGFTSSFKKATNPLVVLSVLQLRPMYGYEITQQLRERSDGRYTIALLYPVLYKLLEQGYIEIAENVIVDGRARTYYTITESGQMYLTETLQSFEEMTALVRTIVGGFDEERH